MRSARGKAAKRRAPPLRRPGTGAFMPVEELWRDHMPEKGRNQVYALAVSGVFPFVRVGRRIDLLREPTLQILAGTREPGRPLLDRPESAAKKRQRAAKKKPSAKPKPVAKKGEAAPTADAP